MAWARAKSGQLASRLKGMTHGALHIRGIIFVQGIIHHAHLLQEFAGVDTRKIETGRTPCGVRTRPCTEGVRLRMTSVAEYVVAQLAAWGVQRIYGVVGDTLFPLMDALSRHHAVRFVPVRHEAAAGFMASAEAKQTGRPAVCLATSGPGIANLLNGLGDAYADRVPVVAITGQVESTKIGTGAKQYVDQQALVRPLAGYTALLASPEAVGQLLPTALRMALGGSQVAHLSVPKDFWDLSCSAVVTPPEPYLGASPVPDPAVILGASARMAKARRPLILLGQGGRQAAGAVLSLAERWGAGIIQSLPAKGAVPGSHPLVLGGLGDGGSDASHTALKEADMLLSVGCNWWPQSYAPAELKVIKIDRVPKYIGGRMPVHYGLAGEAQVIVPQLLKGVTSATDSGWVNRLCELKRAWEVQLEKESVPGNGPLSPQYIVRSLEQVLPGDAIVALDTGDHTVWFNRVFVGDRQWVTVSGKWRSIGYGLPAALAAKLANPDRTVVALVGDTGLQSLMGELATAAELGLPMMIVVVNNGMMAIEYNRAVAKGLNPLGTAPLNPDLSGVAVAAGLLACTVRTADELSGALTKALSETRPTLVNIIASAPVAPTASPS